MISFLQIDFGERGRFVVDASYQFSGPMKLQPMVPYVEQRGIYRFRNVAEEENWFYLERHKKTVLNKQGTGSQIKMYDVPIPWHNGLNACYLFSEVVISGVARTTKI